MRSGSVAFALLSLFTTEQRAAEIEGDLIEEGEHRGRWWFTIHVIGTTFALFNESYKQAPFRITALGVAATGLSVGTCSLLDRVFFVPDAALLARLLGLIVIPASAFATGVGLGYFGSGLGIRAATLTMILLTFLFIVTQTFSGPAQFSYDFGFRFVVAALNAILLMLGYFALSVGIFLAPLMAGSIYGHNRSIGGR